MIRQMIEQANMKIYGKTEENEDSLLTCGNKGDQTVDEMKEMKDASQSNHGIRFIKPLFQNQINQGNSSNEGNNPFC